MAHSVTGRSTQVVRHDLSGIERKEAHESKRPNAQGESTLQMAEGGKVQEAPNCMMSALSSIGKHICWFFEGVYNVFAMLLSCICCNSSAFTSVDSIALPQGEREQISTNTLLLLRQFNQDLNLKAARSSPVYLLQENSVLHRYLNELYENFSLVDAHALQGGKSVAVIKLIAGGECWLRTLYSPLNFEKSPTFAIQRLEAFTRYTEFLFNCLNHKNREERFSLPIRIELDVISLSGNEIITFKKTEERSFEKYDGPYSTGEITIDGGFWSQSSTSKSRAFTRDGAQETFKAKVLGLFGDLSFDPHLLFDETTEEPKALAYTRQNLRF